MLSFGRDSLILYQILKQMLQVLAVLLRSYKLPDEEKGEENPISALTTTIDEGEQAYQALSVRDYQLVVKTLSVFIIYASTVRPVILAL